MADFIKALWSDAIIQQLYEDPDLNAMFNRSLESYAREQGGNKLTIPLLSSNSSIQRTDNKSVGNGLPLGIVDIAKSGLELAIYEYTYGPILIRKVDDVQSNTDLFSMNKLEIAQAIKEFIFTTAMTNIISNVDAANKLKWTGGQAGDAFKYDDLVDMKAALNAAKILQNNRFCALGTVAEKNLSKDSALTNWLAVDQQSVKDGKLPQLQGFSFAPSVLVPKTTAAGAIDANGANNVKDNVVGWRKDYMHLVIQTDLEITGSENPQYLGFVASFTTRFGLLLERATAGVQSTQQ
jgi:hypothetical protein